MTKKEVFPKQKNFKLGKDWETEKYITFCPGQRSK